VNQAAYTMQFGNGFSGSIAIEDPNYHRLQTGILATNGARSTLATVAGITSAGSLYGGVSAPDIVANLRVDQAWGSAQLSGGVHQVKGSYYASNFGTAPAVVQVEDSGAPEDKWGWAIQGGVKVNLPWAAGDTIMVQATYAQGWNHMVYMDYAQSLGLYQGRQLFEGLNMDAVYGAGGDLQLTKTFGINAGIEHYWTPMLRTSVFGAYAKVDYNDTASALICATTAYAASAAGSCNPDWSVYNIGTRTVWNPVKNLDVGLELLYTKFESSHGAGALRTISAGEAYGKSAGTYGLQDQDVFSGQIRVQRNFWP
jgi:hypothetical protein